MQLSDLKFENRVPLVSKPTVVAQRYKADGNASLMVLVTVDPSGDIIDGKYTHQGRLDVFDYALLDPNDEQLVECIVTRSVGDLWHGRRRGAEVVLVRRHDIQDWESAAPGWLIVCDKETTQ